ncbi:hypothetical protein [Alkalinema sp. FACHB-956]|uniref:hypothetical protein n=1 Tax=Alkalinema sp. FACHB-956 TaxID=2692768 RepID=UPI001688D6B2|nr:hypothetical protein [Alkalinema sp. FACHB-956]MBD2325659.1 hypothetical protein [Alkalinema sp. FACHB-956]
MSDRIWYVMRSRRDGQYLAAYPKAAEGTARSPEHGYVLLFNQHADALSYVNRFAPELGSTVAVESMLNHQLSALLERWSFKGVGIVEDPWMPQVQFAVRQAEF